MLIESLPYRDSPTFNIPGRVTRPLYRYLYFSVISSLIVDGHTPGRFSHSGYMYDELRSEVESTYGEMVLFSNADYANNLN
eukprot:COSAG02_NODE_4037_length_5876_cov_16.519474_2_plen_81_part_00